MTASSKIADIQENVFPAELINPDLMEKRDADGKRLLNKKGRILPGKHNRPPDVWGDRDLDREAEAIVDPRKLTPHTFALPVRNDIKPIWFVRLVKMQATVRIDDVHMDIGDNWDVDLNADAKGAAERLAMR